jgi:hypothetical protein
LPSFDQRGDSSYAKISVATDGDNIISGELISFGLPVRIKIPKIHVDTTIKALGLTADGAMDVTKGPYDVAWFNL